MLFRLHPTYRRLNAYVDGNLDPKRHRRVTRHLMQCVRCRNVVRFFEDLRQVIQTIAADVPLPPEGLLEEIYATRDSGIRILLPAPDDVANSPQPRLRKTTFPYTALRVAVVFFLCMLVNPLDFLRAGRGSLIVTPSRPQIGDSIFVHYEPATFFAGYATLRLRGEVFYSPTNYHTQFLAHLVLAKDGRYHGTFAWPDSAVFIRLVVEDSTGRLLDTNARRLWEVLAHGKDGHPLFLALYSRAQALYATHWHDFVSTARSLVRLYPDSPASWRIRLQEDIRRHGLEMTAPFWDTYRREFRRLEHLAISRGYDAQTAAELVLLASTLRDDFAQTRWLERLYAVDSIHDVALVFRALNILRATSMPAADRLAMLEKLWQADRPPYRREIADIGLRIAQTANDSLQPLRWAKRYVERNPRAALSVARALIDNPATRQDGIRFAEDVLRRSETHILWPRPMLVSTTRHVEEIEELRSYLRVEVGLVTFQHEWLPDHLDTLWSAAQNIWEPAAFTRIADVMARAGDTRRAAAILARAVVDPVLPLSQRDSLAAVGLALVDSMHWSAALANAERAIQRHVFQPNVDIHLASGLTIREHPRGSSRLLRKHLDEKLHLVAFYSCACEFEIGSIPEFVTVADSLKHLGIGSLVIGFPEYADSLHDILTQHEFSGPLLLDFNRTVADAFHLVGSPTYFLIDESGIIRFERTNPHALVRPAILWAREKARGAGQDLTISSVP